MVDVYSGLTQCANVRNPEVMMAKYMVHGNWDPGIENHKKEMLYDDPKVERIHKASAVEEVYDVSMLEAERSSTPVLVSGLFHGLAETDVEADAQWFIREVDGEYEVHNPISKIHKDILDPGGMVSKAVLIEEMRID